MITCLNGAQDISVKVISCANLVQKSIDRLSMTQQVAQGYGELLTGAILMSSNMKGEEVLQINLVGGIGAQNMMVVVDSQLRAKGKVGNANFAIGNGVDKLNTAELIGPGQLQVIKNHPFWKQPVNGIVAIRDVPISINLALYMTESEQRLSAIISDIKIENGECKYAVGIMVERLPGATDANVETSIKNLETVAKKGISAYLSTGSDRFTNGEELHKVVDDCVFEMEKGSIRWERKPTFHCSCGLDRVWGALKLLPGSEITDIVESGKGVEVSLTIILLTTFPNNFSVFFPDVDEVRVLRANVQSFI